MAEIVRNEIACGCVIVDHQHAVAGGHVRAGLAGLVTRNNDGRSDRQANRKGCSFANLARHRYIAAHHLAEAARDRQAEAGPAILACGGGVALGEFLEQPPQLFRRHPDAGIGHGNRDAILPLMRDPAHSQNYAAVLRELAGVAQQIEKNLPNPHGVGFDGREVAWTFYGQAILVLLGERACGADDFFDQRRNADALQIELQLPGFDLRQVEDLVDQPEEMRARTVNTAERLQRLLRPKPRRIASPAYR